MKNNLMCIAKLVGIAGIAFLWISVVAIVFGYTPLLDWALPIDMFGYNGVEGICIIGWGVCGYFAMKVVSETINKNFYVE